VVAKRVKVEVVWTYVQKRGTVCWKESTEAKSGEDEERKTKKKMER